MQLPCLTFSIKMCSVKPPSCVVDKWTSEWRDSNTSRSFRCLLAKATCRINGYYNFINCDLRRKCEMLCRPWFMLCRQLGRVPIARFPPNLFSSPIPRKSSGNPNHVQFGQCGKAEFNALTWSWNIFCFSQSVYAIVSQGEFQPLSMTDIHWETVKRYLSQQKSIFSHREALPHPTGQPLIPLACVM